MGRIRKHSSRELEDHIVSEGHGVELGAEGAPVKDVQWETKSAEVHADPILDSGSGRKIIVRRFFFKLAPGVERLSSEEILAWHKKHTLIPTLWRDELELADEPRIIPGKKGNFTIVAVCTATTKLGVRSVIHERPELVQNIIKNGHDSRQDTA